MADDLYSKYLGLAPGKRPPRSFELLGIPANTRDAQAIEAAAARCMDKLDRFALSSDSQTRDEVQRLMNEVAKARTRLVARIPKPKPEATPPVEPVPTPPQQAPKPDKPAPMPAAKSASAASQATALAPVPAPVSASAEPSSFTSLRPKIVFWSLFVTFWAGSLAAVYAVTFAVATPGANEPTESTPEPAVVAATEPSTEPEPAVEPAPQPQPPAPKPVAQLPSITDPRFKEFKTNWRQDTQSKKWDLNIYATYEHGDDQAHVVGVRQNMLLLGVSGLDSYRPHFWSDPKRRDDPQGGNWERYDRLEQSRPFTDRFSLGFTHIPKPVAEITDLSAKFHIRVATNVSHTDIPLDQHGRWLELAPGIRGKIDLSSQGDTHFEPGKVGQKASQSHRATVYYEDSYLKAGPTFIEAYAIYDDGTKGKSIYGRGGGSQGDVRFRFLGFMGGDRGQRLNAIRFYYADGWKEQEVQLKMDKLPTPGPATEQLTVEQPRDETAAPSPAPINPRDPVAVRAEQERLALLRKQEADRQAEAQAEQERLAKEKARAEQERQRQETLRKQETDRAIADVQAKQARLAQDLRDAQKRLMDAQRQLKLAQARMREQQARGTYDRDEAARYKAATDRYSAEADLYNAFAERYRTESQRLSNELLVLRGQAPRPVDDPAEQERQANHQNYLDKRDQLTGWKKVELIEQEMSKRNDGMKVQMTSDVEDNKIVGLDFAVWIDRKKVKPGNERITDLSALAGLKHVKRLDLSHLSKLTDLDALEGMPLEWLNIRYCRGLADISAIKGMPIKWLSMSDLQITDLEPLRGMPLEYLWCMTTHKITSTAPLKGIAIQTIKLNACSRLTDLTGLESLNAADGEVSLYNTPITDLSPLKGQKIGILNLGSCDELVTLDGLEGAQIGQLDLRNLDKLKDLSALPKIRVTDRFYLSNKLIDNLKVLRGLDAKTVTIACPNVQRLDGLEDLPNMEYLDLQSMNHLTREEVQRIRSRYDDLGGFDPRSHRE